MQQERFDRKDLELGNKFNQHKFGEEKSIDEQNIRESFFNKSCPYCVPSSPIPGLIDAQKNIKSPPPPEIMEALEKIHKNTSSPLIEKLKKCGDTVYSLRKFNTIGNLDASSNMIQNFEKVCLAKNVSTLLLSSCRANYNDYINYCLENTASVSDQRIINRIGVLIVANGKYKGTPACTATIISSIYLITARHCYAEKEGENEQISGNSYLTFSPNPQLITQESNDGNYSNEIILGELTDDGVKDIKMLDHIPPTSKDVIILVLKNPIQLEKPELKIKISQNIINWQQLTLIGYQEMVTRRDNLYSQGFYLPNETPPNYYIQNIMMDNSISCFVSAYKPGGFKHSCQSFYGTSGAPIFAGDLKNIKIENDTVYISGIQSAGNGSSTKELEMQGSPNTAAVIRDATLDILLKNNVNMR